MTLAELMQCNGLNVFDVLAEFKWLIRSDLFFGEKHIKTAFFVYQFFEAVVNFPN